MRLFKLLILSAILCSFTACGTDPGTGGHKPDANCGNDTLDAGEECDGSKLRDADCTALDSSKVGKLTCDSSCHYVKTQCKDKSSGSGSCGNGTLDAGEECEGSKLRDADCTALDSSKVGKLTCDSSCHYVKTQCKDKPTTCGDGNLDPGEECDGTHLKETDCSKVDATKVGTLTCVVGGCTYDKSSCTDKPTGTLTQDASCDKTDACAPGLACLPKLLAKEDSSCQKVNTLGCKTDADCHDSVKTHCIHRRSMGKEISFCSDQKECTNSNAATVCAAGEYCLPRDNNFDRGVCTAVTKCPHGNECDSLSGDWHCGHPNSAVSGSYYETICIKGKELGAGERGCSDTVPCQKGLACVDAGIGGGVNICTVQCSRVGLTPECTYGLADYCLQQKDVLNHDVKVCAPSWLVSNTFINNLKYGDECDSVSKFCGQDYTCLGTTENPTVGKCVPVCKGEKEDGTMEPNSNITCDASIGGTQCKTAIQHGYLTYPDEKNSYWEYSTRTHYKTIYTCGN